MMSSKGTRKFIDIDDLEAGDIVEFVRAGGMYRHCGVYDGNYGVIHRAAEPGAGSRVALDARGIFAKLGIESDKAEIRRDELRKVAGSSVVYRTNIYDSVIRPFPRKEILRRAEERLGEKGYNIIYKNCQHFCTGIRYGTAMIMEYQPERKMILPSGKFNHSDIKENVNMTEKSLLDQVRAASKESVALAMKISADVVVCWNTSQYNTTTQRSKFPWKNTKFGNESITTITQKSRCICDNCMFDLQDLVKDVDIDRCYTSRDRLPDYLEYKYEPLFDCDTRSGSYMSDNREYSHSVAANMFGSIEQLIYLDANNTRNDTLSCIRITPSDISCAVANPYITPDMLLETGNSFSTRLFNNNFANRTCSATGNYNCIEGGGGGGCVIL